MTIGHNNTDIESHHPSHCYHQAGSETLPSTSEGRGASGKAALLLPVGGPDRYSVSVTWQLWFDTSLCAGLWAVLCGSRGQT